VHEASAKIERWTSRDQGPDRTLIELRWKEQIKTQSPDFRPAIFFWTARISYRGAPAAAAIGKLGIGWRAPLPLAEATP
jgi:hypothetical protein